MEDVEELRRLARDSLSARETAAERREAAREAAANSTAVKIVRGEVGEEEDIERVAGDAKKRLEKRERQRAERGYWLHQTVFPRPIPSRREARLAEAPLGAPLYTPREIDVEWRPQKPRSLKEDVSLRLPVLEDEMRLPDGAWAALRREGHVFLRGLFNEDEVRSLRGRLIEAHEQKQSQKKQRDQGEDNTEGIQDDIEDLERNSHHGSYTRLDNPWRFEPAAQLLASSSRLAGTASALLGVDHLRLYQDSIRVKEPGDAGSPWHVDLSSAPFETEKYITAWVALVDMEERMGTPHFAKASHRAEVTGWDLDDKQLRGDFEVTGGHAIRAGDVFFYMGWTMHGAGSNTGGWRNEAYVASFIPEGTHMVELKDFHVGRMSSHDKDSYGEWLHEVTPGAPVNHASLPTVFNRQLSEQIKKERSKEGSKPPRQDVESSSPDVSSKDDNEGQNVDLLGGGNGAAQAGGDDVPRLANQTLEEEIGGSLESPKNETEARCDKVAQAMRVLCDALGEGSDECGQVTKRFQNECG